ncbi:hypothetical protein WDU94_005587 [Cyamophila willieti]
MSFHSCQFLILGFLIKLIHRTEHHSFKHYSCVYKTFFSGVEFPFYFQYFYFNPAICNFHLHTCFNSYFNDPFTYFSIVNFQVVLFVSADGAF